MGPQIMSGADAQAMNGFGQWARMAFSHLLWYGHSPGTVVLLHEVERATR